jgi:uncharacterized protein YwgA
MLALLESGKGLDPVRLQKCLFLFGERLPKLTQQFYKFKPYNYGPFCQDIYRDAEALQSQGLVAISGSGATKFYRLTSAGVKEASGLLETVPEIARKFLCDVTAWASSLTFPQLVSAIYKEFPKYKQNSVFQQ